MDGLPGLHVGNETCSREISDILLAEKSITGNEKHQVQEENTNNSEDANENTLATFVQAKEYNVKQISTDGHRNVENTIATGIDNDACQNSSAADVGLLCQEINTAGTEVNLLVSSEGIEVSHVQTSDADSETSLIKDNVVNNHEVNCTETSNSFEEIWEKEKSTPIGNACHDTQENEHNETSLTVNVAKNSEDKVTNFEFCNHQNTIEDDKHIHEDKTDTLFSQENTNTHDCQNTTDALNHQRGIESDKSGENVDDSLGQGRIDNEEDKAGSDQVKEIASDNDGSQSIATSQCSKSNAGEMDLNSEGHILQIIDSDNQAANVNAPDFDVSGDESVQMSAQNAFAVEENSNELLQIDGEHRASDISASEEENKARDNSANEEENQARDIGASEEEYISASEEIEDESKSHKYDPQLECKMYNSSDQEPGETTLFEEQISTLQCDGDAKCIQETALQKDFDEKETGEESIMIDNENLKDLSGSNIDQEPSEAILHEEQFGTQPCDGEVKRTDEISFQKDLDEKNIGEESTVRDTENSDDLSKKSIVENTEEPKQKDSHVENIESEFTVVEALSNALDEHVQEEQSSNESREIREVLTGVEIRDEGRVEKPMGSETDAACNDDTMSEQHVIIDNKEKYGSDIAVADMESSHKGDSEKLNDVEPMDIDNENVAPSHDCESNLMQQNMATSHKLDNQSTVSEIVPMDMGEPKKTSNYEIENENTESKIVSGNTAKAKNMPSDVVNAENEAVTMDTEKSNKMHGSKEDYVNTAGKAASMGRNEPKNTPNVSNATIENCKLSEDNKHVTGLQSKDALRMDKKALHSNVVIENNESEVIAMLPNSDTINSNTTCLKVPNLSALRNKFRNIESGLFKPKTSNSLIKNNLQPGSVAGIGTTSDKANHQQHSKPEDSRRSLDSLLNKTKPNTDHRSRRKPSVTNKISKTNLLESMIPSAQIKQEIMDSYETYIAPTPTTKEMPQNQSSRSPVNTMGNRNLQGLYEITKNIRSISEDSQWGPHPGSKTTVGPRPSDSRHQPVVIAPQPDINPLYRPTSNQGRQLSNYGARPSASHRHVSSPGYGHMRSPSQGRMPSPHHGPIPSPHHGPVPSPHHGPVPSPHHGPVPSPHHGPVPSPHHGSGPSPHHGPVPSPHHGPVTTIHHGAMPAQSQLHPSVVPVSIGPRISMATNQHNPVMYAQAQNPPMLPRERYSTPKSTPMSIQMPNMSPNWSGMPPGNRPSMMPVLSIQQQQQQNLHQQQQQQQQNLHHHQQQLIAMNQASISSNNQTPSLNAMPIGAQNYEVVQDSRARTDASPNTNQSVIMKNPNNDSIATASNLNKRLLACPKSITPYVPPKPPANLEIKETMSLHKCNGCTDAFLHESSLKNHQERKSFNIEFHCPYCKVKLTFYNRCALHCHVGEHGDMTVTQKKILADRVVVSKLSRDLLPRCSTSVFNTTTGNQESATPLAAQPNKQNSLTPEEPIPENRKKACTPTTDVAEDAGQKENKSQEINGNVNSDSSKKEEAGIVTKKKGLSCAECKNNYMSVKGLERHFSYCYQKCNGIHHYKSKCTECELVLMGPCSQKAHLRIHKRQTPYVCPECGETVRGSFNVFNIHLQKKCFHFNRIMEIDCPKCHKVFEKEKNLRNHLKAAHGERYYKCSKCPMAFKSQEAFSHHELNTHDCKTGKINPIHKCPLCDTVFPQESQLETHTSVHIVDICNKLRYFFRCASCQEKYKYKHELVMHMESKHGYRSIKNLCDICGSPFQNNEALKKHIRNAHPKFAPTDDTPTEAEKEKPKEKKAEECITKKKFFTCNLCYFAFTTQEDFEKHKKTHKNEGKKRKSTDSVESKRSSLDSSSPKPSKRMKADDSGDTDNSQRKTPDSASKKSKGKITETRTTPTSMVEIQAEPQVPCSECEHLFFTDAELQKHLADVHAIEPLYPCHLCGLTYKSTNHLKSHLKSAHEGNIVEHAFVCWICAEKNIHKSYPQQISLEKHLHNSHKIAKCNIDYSKIVAVDYVKEEENNEPISSEDPEESQPMKKLKVDGDSSFMCAKCTFTCEDRTGFLEHIVKHKNRSESMQCGECGLSFAVQPSLKRHLFMVHKIKNFTNYMKETGVDLITPPKETYSFPLPFNTPVQNRSSSNGTSSDAGSEMESDSSSKIDVQIRSLECTVCYKCFDSLKTLRNHMRSHGMAFIRSKRLNPIADF